MLECFCSQAPALTVTCRCFQQFCQRHHSLRCFPWPPTKDQLKLLNWGFTCTNTWQPPLKPSWMDQDAFWALLTSTTTPGDDQNHIPSISPGNHLSFYAQNWTNPWKFILTWKEPYWMRAGPAADALNKAHNSQVTFQCPQGMLENSIKSFRGPDYSKARLIQNLCICAAAALPTQFSLSVVGFGALKRANN